MRPFLCTISRIFCAVVLRKKKKKKITMKATANVCPLFFKGVMTSKDLGGPRHEQNVIQPNPRC